MALKMEIVKEIQELKDEINKVNDKIEKLELEHKNILQRITDLGNKITEYSSNTSEQKTNYDILMLQQSFLIDQEKRLFGQIQFLYQKEKKELSEKKDKLSSQLSSLHTGPLIENTTRIFRLMTIPSNEVKQSESMSYTKMVLETLQMDFERPIPVSPSTYNDAITKIVDEKKRKLIEKIICSAEIGHDLMTEFITALSFNTNAIDSENETTASAPLITLLHSIFTKFVKNLELTKQSYAECNSASLSESLTKNSSGKTEKRWKARRDMLFYFNGLVIIFAEFKPKSVPMSDCLDQVQKNIGKLNSRIYGKIPFILCFTQSGPKLQLHIFFRKDENGFLDKPLKCMDCEALNFDLCSTYERLLLVKTFINALCIFNGFYMQSLFPKYPLALTLNRYRKTKNSEYVLMMYKDDFKTGDVMVYKKIENFSNYEFSNNTNLLEIYNCIKHGKINHSYKNFSFEYSKKNDEVECTSKALDSIEFAFEDKSNEEKTKLAIKLIQDIGEALESLHTEGFVHRDIRLTNILYDCGTKEFILIDFDCGDKIGEPIKQILNGYKSEWKIGYKYQINDDLYLFGKLIKNEILSLANLPSKILDLAKKLNDEQPSKVVLKNILNELKSQ